MRRSSGGGEAQNQPFQFSFNSSLKIDFQGSRVTSDGGLVLGARVTSYGGLILVRELDERMGLSAFNYNRHDSRS